MVGVVKPINLPHMEEEHMRNFLFILFCSLPLVAGADISAVYEVDNGNNLTIHYRDADHLRMEMAPDQFMLVSDGTVYMVRKENGQWMAMDMSAMGRMMKQMGRQAAESAPEIDPDDYSIEDTGRTETVAGYDGKVYQAVGPDGERTEMVMSSHEDIRTLNRAWMALSGKMVKNMGGRQEEGMESLFEQSAFKELGGALRVDDDMRLKSVSTDKRADDFFSLPEGTRVQDMSGMGGMPGR